MSKASSAASRGRAYVPEPDFEGFGRSQTHQYGFAVELGPIAGASERSIMNQTGHRSVLMVRRYIRDGSLFRENSAGKLGL